jgi:hypothetical protein
VERRTRSHRRTAPGGVAAKPAASAPALAHIARLIDEGGQITVGQIHPIDCAAIAHDGNNTLAMLQRLSGETLPQLLARLDAAVALAWDDNRFTDEINLPLSTPALSRSRRR